MAAPVSRLSFIGVLWKEGLWGKVGAFVVGAIGLASSALTFVPSYAPDAARYTANIPRVSPMIWLALFLLMALLWCFEAAYRSHVKSAAMVGAMQAKLDSPRQRQRELLAQHMVDARVRLASLVIEEREALCDSSKKADRAALTLEIEALRTRFNDEPDFFALYLEYQKAAGAYSLAGITRLGHEYKSVGLARIVEDMQLMQVPRDQLFSSCGNLVSWLLMTGDDIKA